MVLRYASGWLLFDENYLLLGCNYLSDYSRETFLSKHLGAFERLKCTCSFRFTRRDTEIFICLFVSTVFLTRYIIDSGCLSCLVHCLLILWRQTSHSIYRVIVFVPVMLHMLEAPFSFMFPVLCAHIIDSTLCCCDLMNSTFGD